MINKIKSATKKIKTKLPYILMTAGSLAIFGLAYKVVPEFALADAETDEPYSIYIVAGQSNAEGSSSFRVDIPEGQKIGQHPVDDAEEPDDNAQIWWRAAGDGGVTTPNDFLLALFDPTYSTANWSESQNTEDPTQEGLINFKDLDTPVPMGQPVGQFGSELSIARELHNKGRRKTIILKVTYGFQALAKSTSPFIPFDWYPDIPGQAPRNKSYTNLKTEFEQLTSLLRARGDTYTVDGVFWLQGETDTLDSGYTAKYEENYDLLVNRVKEDLHLHPDAHFVGRKFNFKNCIDGAYPAVGNYCSAGYAMQLEGKSVAQILEIITINPLISIPLNSQRIRTVRDVIQNTADKYDWVDAVETDDAPFANDFIHLNADGQLETGRRMINMYDLPYRADLDAPIQNRNDYDGDGIVNSSEDTGRGAGCPYLVGGQPVNTANNGNLGDDDSDCDGFPNYLDRINGPGSGMAESS